jgi:hypothetical protein
MIANETTVYVKEPDGKETTGTVGVYVWGDNIEMNIIEIACDGMCWILSRDRTRWWAVFDTVINIFCFYYFE